MILKILASIALLCGGYVSLGNWWMLYAWKKSGKSGSTVPIVGGLLLFLGLCGFDATRPYAWFGFCVDFGTFVFLYSLPFLIREAWRSSRFNLLHRFESNDGVLRVSVRLFRGSRAWIEYEYRQPVPCDEYVELAGGGGLVGVWRENGAGFLLDKYAGARTLRIRRTRRGYLTSELHYPRNRPYPYDRLDGLTLTKVK
jgi:hypothetical protein